jgi:RND family efflux transporter MFP subunit
MKLLEALKGRLTYLVLGASVIGVIGYEWHQIRASSVIPVAAAEPKAGERRILAEGRVVAYPGGEVTLAAELPGKLVKLGVKERDRVKQGDVVAELDVEEQLAALTEANARVRESDSDILYLGKEKERSELLFGQRVVAEAERDRSTHAARSAERRRASLLAGAARIRTVIEKSKIATPRSGVVTARFVDEGEMVHAGQPLLTVVDLDARRIEAEVGEFDAGRVRVGQTAKIRAEGYANQVWSARVEEIPDVVVPRSLRPLDPASPVDTRVLLVKLALAEALPLKLGQRVEVDIQP